MRASLAVKSIRTDWPALTMPFGCMVTVVSVGGTPSLPGSARLLSLTSLPLPHADNRSTQVRVRIAPQRLARVPDRPRSAFEMCRCITPPKNLVFQCLTQLDLDSSLPYVVSVDP